MLLPYKSTFEYHNSKVIENHDVIFDICNEWVQQYNIMFNPYINRQTFDFELGAYKVYDC